MPWRHRGPTRPQTHEFAWPALWPLLAGVHDRHDVGRGVIMERADVPEADRAEHSPADDPFDERPSGPVASNEVPEADSIEQALPANSQAAPASTGASGQKPTRPTGSIRASSRTETTNAPTADRRAAAGLLRPAPRLLRPAPRLLRSAAAVDTVGGRG